MQGFHYHFIFEIARGNLENIFILPQIFTLISVRFFCTVSISNLRMYIRHWFPENAASCKGISKTEIEAIVRERFESVRQNPVKQTLHYFPL